MKKVLGWGLRIAGLLVVVMAVLAAFNWERLVRLYNVNTLFSEQNIVRNFSHMQESFLWAPVPNESAVVREWPVALAPMPKTYLFDGKTAAHRAFRDDGEAGRSIKHENIALFRAIARHYSGWQYPGS